MRLSRRTFLGGSLAAAAGLAHRRAFGAEPAPLPDLVDVHGKDPKRMVVAALAALGGIEAFVKPGAKVVVKPNFSFDNPPEFGTGTHPETLQAVLEACLAAKAGEVVVLEYLLRKKERCLERTGTAAMLARLPKVRLKLLGEEEDEFEEVVIPGAAELKKVGIAKVLRAADVYINVPQAKHHGSGKISFGLKNAMGVIQDRKAFHGTYDLQVAIADLARVVKPQLTVLDATRVLVDKGPAGPGPVEQLGRIVAGRNVVSVDAYGLGLAKFAGKRLSVADVPHIALAGKAGLGETDVGKLKVKKLEV